MIRLVFVCDMQLGLRWISTLPIAHCGETHTKTQSMSTLGLLSPHKNCVQNKMWILIFRIINFKIEMAGKEKTAETQTHDDDKVT